MRISTRILLALSFVVGAVIWLFIVQVGTEVGKSLAGMSASAQTPRSGSTDGLFNALTVVFFAVCAALVLC